MKWLSGAKYILWGSATLVTCVLLLHASGANPRAYLGYAPTATPRPTIIPPTITDHTTLGPLITSPTNPPEHLSTRPLPTNEWWSSGILERWPSPLFVWPQQVTISQNGITVATPATTVIPRAALATPRDAIRIFPTGNALSSAYPYRWGDWDVTFRVQDEQGIALLDVTMISGSPRTTVQTYAKEITINLPPQSQLEELQCTPACGVSWIITSAETRYILSTPTGTTNTSSFSNSLQITLPKASSHISLTTVAPNSDIANYLPYLQETPSATQTIYKVEKDTITTTFLFSHPTLMGVLPHHQPYVTHKPSTLIGSFDTLHGPIHVYGGQEFTTALATPAVTPGLPLSPELRDDPQFQAQIEKDIQESTFAGGDVYASAKEVLRIAQLSELAPPLPDTSLAIAAQQKLEEQLINWCTFAPEEKNNYLAYDTQRGGIIAIPPAFGSDNYNDHHFHYGYFIHAAAIAARHNPIFVQNFGNCITLLIEDIAAIAPDSPSFPRLRAMDPYAGHSWANGHAATGDGNNQESTSEAIHAWYATALWGKITNNAEIEQRGLWLMAQEIASARTYWLNLPPGPRTLPPNFPYPIATIVWSGKIDYQTFFDPSPAAIHGIQFFPVTAALLPVVDGIVVEKIIDPILSTASNSIWKTTLQAAAALQHPNLEPPVSPKNLDTVYSLSYLHNWHAIIKEWGTLQATPPQPCGYTWIKDKKTTAAIYRFAQDQDSCMFAHPLSKELTTLDKLTPGWNIREIQ